MSSNKGGNTMPFGKHKGKAFEDVPADYLLYCHENMELFGNLKAYIEDNLEEIKVEGAKLKAEYQASKA